MSLRTFTVFQDAALSEAPQPKVARPNAMMTRSSTRNIASSSSATASGEAAIIDKENYHPVTGERAGPSGGENKKRKTILATKAQLAPVTKLKKEKDLHVEPQAKKRKPSTIATAKPKTKKDVKGTGSTKKSTAKRTGSKKVSPLPKVNEEEEGEKDRPTQADIDSRCYELTVKPLADVSEAYNELDVFQDLVTATTTAKNVVADDKVKYRTVKVSYYSSYHRPLPCLLLNSLRSFRPLLLNLRSVTTSNFRRPNPVPT